MIILAHILISSVTIAHCLYHVLMCFLHLESVNLCKD